MTIARMASTLPVVPPTQAPALARLADHLLDGQLAAFIRDSRSQKPPKSWDWIARELYIRTEHQVDATGPTVQSWVDRLDEGAA